MSTEPAALEAAVAGADAVLSALGPRSTADFGIASRGTRAIVRAMRATGVRRLLVVSAAPVATVASPGRPDPPKHDPGDGFVMRHLFSPLIKVVLRRHYADLARMEDLLRASGLEWTAFRPPRLTDRPAIGQNLRGGFRISRADVAHAMLEAVDRPATVGQTVGIAD